MAVSPLNAFTFQQATTVTCLGVANAFPLPTGTSPTTVLITNLRAEPACVALTTPAATTTGTAASGSTSVVVTSATGIAVGQIVLGVGIAGGVNIPATISGQYPNSVAVTVVTGISGTTITLSSPTTAALSTTTLVFVASLVLGAGLVVMPRSAPIPLVIGSNTYLQAVSLNPQVGVQLNIAVGV